jgi:hypothetical protein
MTEERLDVLTSDETTKENDMDHSFTSDINPFAGDAPKESDKILHDGKRLTFKSRTQSNTSRDGTTVRYLDTSGSRPNRERLMRGDAWDSLQDAPRLVTDGERLCEEWRAAAIRYCDSDTSFNGTFHDMADYLQKAWNLLGDKYIRSHQAEVERLKKELEKTRSRERQQAMEIGALTRLNREQQETIALKTQRVGELVTLNRAQANTISYLRGVL